MNPQWHYKALCAKSNDPELWWYEQARYNDEQIETAYRVAEAIRICNECPVKAECLEEGLRPEDLLWGVRGGMTAGERILLADKAKKYRYEYNREVGMIRRVRYILKHGKLHPRMLKKL